VSGPTFGFPHQMGAPTGGPQLPVSGKYRKLTITASQIIDDPSGGKAGWFRVTVQGAGGGGSAMGNSTSYNSNRASGGGAGETIVVLLHNSEIKWPVQITIGAGGTGGVGPVTTTIATGTSGGSTSFGDMFTALGGSPTGFSGGYLRGLRVMVGINAAATNAPNHPFWAGDVYGTSYQAMDSGCLTIPNGVVFTGAAGSGSKGASCGINMGGAAPGGGASYFSPGKDGADLGVGYGFMAPGYGAGGAGNSNINGKAGPGGSGVVVLEWME